MCNDATAIPVAPRFSARRRRRVTLAHGLRVAAGAALSWAERARQRRALRELDDWLLRDIGLTRRQVEGECAKPFWRP